MDIEKKSEQAELNLERKLEWIGRHDNRTMLTIGIVITMLGLLASATSKIAAWNAWYCLVFGIAALSLFVSLLFIYKSQYPKTVSQNTSLNYFGTIAEMRFDEFKRRTKQAAPEEYLDDILCQVHTNSQILQLKFRFLKTALIFLCVSIVPWLICIYLSHEFIR